MATKTKVRSGPFDKAILAAARRLVDAYDIVMRREEGEWVGHALEYPEAIGVGKTVQWDGPNMKCINMPENNKLINLGYRKGWAPRA